MKLFYASLLALMLSPLQSFGAAAKCELAVQSGIDANGKPNPMAFNVKSIEVPASCKKFKITLENKSTLPKTAMGHNLVVSEAGKMAAVTAAALKAGIKNEYLQKGSGEITATKLLGPSEKDSVTLVVANLKKGSAYKFFCTFPGHSAMMQGDLSVK